MVLSKLPFLKFLELALTCTCVGLDYHSFNWDIGITMLVHGTFIGYLIIIVGSAAGTIMQTPMHKRIDMFFCLVGVVLFIASGAVVIDHTIRIEIENMKSKNYGTPLGILFGNFFLGISEHEYKALNLAKASLAIINGAVLLVDAILIHRSEKATSKTTHSLVATSTSLEYDIMQSNLD